MQLRNSSGIAGSIFLISLFAAPSAFAGRISYDFQYGDTASSDHYYAASGLSMPEGFALGGGTVPCSLNALADTNAPVTSCALDLTGSPTHSTEVALGFTINGFSSIFVNEDGLITFGQSAPATLVATDFASLQSQLGSTPFIAPAYADMQSGTADFFGLASGNSGMLIQRGWHTLDPALYNQPLVADPLAALGITWVSTFNNQPFSTELVLRELAGGGFLAEFSYGSSSDGIDNPLINTFAGYSLGGTSVSWSEAAFATNTSVTFNGTGGGGGGGGGTNVPEPGTLALMGLGLLGLLTMNRRQRALR